VAGKLYDSVGEGGVFFSADGNRSAYMAKRGDKWFLVVDQVESEAYDSVDGSPVFSPDGQHVAIAALKKPAWYAVVDGKLSPAFPGVDQPVLAGNPVRCAHVVWRGKQRTVVADGLGESKEFEAIDNLAFNADGSHLIYKGRRGEKWIAVIDGKEGPEFDFVEDLAFTPGGKHVLYRGGMSKPAETYCLVVDGVPGKPYERVNEPIISNDDGRYAYICWLWMVTKASPTRCSPTPNSAPTDGKWRA
jgi:hypothetical protein